MKAAIRSFSSSIRLKPPWLPETMATSVLVGQSSVEQAQAVIDYHLHRLFPASEQRNHRKGGHPHPTTVVLVDW
jgi:hypothetical protein